MTLKEIRSLVDNSTATDWNKLQPNTVEKWNYGQRDGANFIEPIVHESMAVLLADIDISLAWGATVNDDFSEPWHQSLPDKSASSVLVIMCHNGAKVDEWTFVIVDGGRYILPLPQYSNGAYHIPQTMMPLGRLLYSLYSPAGVHETLEDLLKRCKIAII